MRVVHWCLCVCLLCLFATGQQAVAASEAQLVVRTPELAPSVTFSPETRAWLSVTPSIRIAFWGRARPPLHMGFDPGGFEGVTADMLGLLQQMLGVPFQMLHYPSREEALKAMAKDEVDMLALSDVAENGSPLFSASKPYLLNREVIVRRFNQTHKSSANLSGERLAYIADSREQAGRLKEAYPQSTLVPYTDYLNAIAGLAYDQADVFQTDAVTAEFLISRFYRNDVYIVGDAVSGGVADLDFAVSIRQPQLLEAINQSLTAIPVASILRITSRWGLNNNFVVARPSLNLTQEQSAWVAAHKTLKVAVTNSYAPVTFFDEKNQLKGLGAEVLKRVGQLTGLTFEIVRHNSVNDMLEQLQSNKVDLVAALSIGEHSINPKQITRSYLVSPFVVVTRRSEAGIRSLDELNGLRLALSWGNPLTSWVHEHYPKIHTVTVRNATQGIEMLADKEVEGTVSTKFSADYFISQHFKADLHIASVIGPRPAMISMVVAPADQELKGIIDAALLTIAPEELKEMSDRWRNNAAPAVASPWNTYKDVVVQVVVGAVLLVLVFLVWNYYLRVQIQKRQKAERDLEDQLQFSRTLIDGAPVALYVRDTEGRLVQCNQAYLDFFNMSRESLFGKTLVESQVFDAEFSARYHQTYLDTLAHGQPAFTDMDVEVQGQSYRVYHWILPFHNSSGQYIGVIGGWLDITEREHLIEQLRLAKEAAMDANRSKSVFLASMSHEIRTPVSALVGLIELLRLKGGSTDEIEESLEVAHQSAKSLLSLIGDILDLSKIEAGEMTPTPRPTHLGEMTQSIYRLFETNARKKNLDYRLVTEVQHNGILIDALMLNQIIANLLSNAIKFTDQGSVQLMLRELSGESAPGRARFAIQVSDTGKGLSETQHQEIFEPFVQADPQANRAVGTGLGLSICASLAKLLNAQLNVDSQLGLGSRFTLMFEAEMVEVEERLSSPAFDSSNGHKLKILVVEDHAPNRLLLCRQLEYLGHEAWPCDDGETALAQWKGAQPPFDLTITDCNMPRVDGYQLTRWMREDEQQRAVRLHPIFGLTANAQSEIIDRCLAAGMTRCLFKPVGMETLALLVAEVEQTSKRRVQAAIGADSELDKIRLLSPESYAPLVNEIVLTHRADGHELQRLAKEEKRDDLARVAHKIRGGAHLAGDRSLNDACVALEQLLAEDGEPLLFRQQTEVVLKCLHELEVRLLQGLAS
ncbi:transporter substrate-binding domain-containing protein [Pseudomonas sp. HS6]|uniref:transporter substrate-binding domain-containing protein n=1 Tax=Pseudomonas sp. HS6 TaxID=2850559 RepID=UPI002019FC32|nr:transporter substrate-binding domain-containing protein [Pseudomonas sp. HS6]